MVQHGFVRPILDEKKLSDIWGIQMLFLPASLLDRTREGKKQNKKQHIHL